MIIEDEGIGFVFHGLADLKDFISLSPDLNAEFSAASQVAVCPLDYVVLLCL